MKSSSDNAELVKNIAASDNNGSENYSGAMKAALLLTLQLYKKYAKKTDCEKESE